MEDSELDQVCRVPSVLGLVQQLIRGDRFAKLALSSSKPKVAAVALGADPTRTEAAKRTSARSEAHSRFAAVLGEEVY